MVTILVRYMQHLHICMEGIAQINVEDKGVAQTNVASSQASGTGQPDHWGWIGPL